ncbi:unnamed protein product [Mytilus coruscus]|uniref:Uncharacterized protein n=1 Tax=Mytilus coruscus TaxID=42192 RepID=A0A6J8C9B1_MYTCO|nr:unnamed protein product [Mytilus coruscus]
MRLGTKSDLLLKCLEPLTTTTCDVPEVDVLVIDGAAIVNMLKPSTYRTFDDYADLIFCPYIRKHLETVARQLAQQNFAEKVVVATNTQDVLCYPPRDDVSNLASCSHEEADTRIMVHLSDAVKHGLKRVMIRTVDTDVAVIAVSPFRKIGADELWLAFGSGKSFRYISIHELSNALGIEISHTLPVFHAFTGCDTVSSFAGKGKKTAWETWMAFEDVTLAFRIMIDQPTSPEMDFIMALIERYVVLIYWDKTVQSFPVRPGITVFISFGPKNITTGIDNATDTPTRTADMTLFDL